MEAKNKIDALRQKALSRYLSNEFELKRDLDIEKHDIEGYHGREILELLQNVDDACSRSSNNDSSKDVVKATICYENDVLTVSNTGTEFGFDGIQSLVFGHISTKDSDSIGSKGSGFRGLLNWSDKIKIYSGEYRVEFSKEFASQRFKENQDNENLKSQIEYYKRKENKELCFPMLSMPKYIEECIESKYDTVIEIDISQNKNTGDYTLEKQLESFDYRTLLFLPNLTQIDIFVDGNQKSFIKELITENGLDYVILSVVENNEKINEETYIIKKQELLDLDGNKYLLIAVPLHEMEGYPIYSYFPTQEKSPFPVLMHAPFSLSSDRNHIPTENSGYNKKLFEQLITLLADIANRIVTLVEKRTIAVEIVTPDNLSEYSLWNFSGVFSKFNLQQHFFDIIKDLTIFPTVNGTFTNICDGVKRLIQKAPLVFKEDEFELLLEHLSVGENDALVSVIAKKHGVDIEYTDKELCEKINKKQLSILEQIEVFLWWNNNRKNSLVLPNVLKDASNNVIEYDKAKRCFLSTDTGINELPAELGFVNLTVLHMEYQAELTKQVQSSDKQNWENIKTAYTQANSARILAAYSDKNFNIKFIEQSSRDAVVREINNQVKTQEQAIVYYKWLFDLYHNEKNTDTQSFERIDYKLPSSNEAIAASKLYFGSGWGNELGEKIFSLAKSGNDSMDCLMEPSAFGINAEEQEQHKQFLSQLGVKTFPTIHTKSYEWCDLNAFRSFIQKKHNFDFNINYLDIYLIDSFESIISQLSMDEILKWIKSDNSLHSHLLSIDNRSRVRQKSNHSGHWFATNEYIVWVLNNTAWLEFDNNKYTPKQIVAYGKLKSQCDGLLGIAEKELLDIVGDTLYKTLEFKKSLGELSAAQIKSLLLALPDFRVYKGEVSRKLYREIIARKVDQKPEYDTSEVKVLCKDGKFYDSKDVRYAYGKLPKSISSKEKLVDIGDKQSTNTIQNWLGVTKYETFLQYHCSKESLIDVNAFKRQIEELKIVVLSTIEITKENISKIKRLTIEPHSNIIAKDLSKNGNTIPLDDYNYIESMDKRAGENIYLINIASSVMSIDQLFLVSEFAKEIANIFKEALNLNVNESLIELLVGRNTASRKQKIAEEYDVDRWNDAYEAIYEKSTLSAKISEYFKKYGVRDLTLTQLEKINFANILDVSELEFLIQVFMEYKMPTSEFEDVLDGRQLDFHNFWIVKIKEYCQSHLDDYLSSLYTKLATQGQVEQEQFLELADSFQYFSPSNEQVPNEVDFDVKAYVVKKFEIDIGNDALDVGDIYARNYKILNVETSEEQLFGDFIDSHKNLKSLIYFLYGNTEYKDLILSRYNEIKMIKTAEGISVDCDKDKPTLGVLSKERVVADLNNQSEKENATSNKKQRIKTVTQQESQNQGKARNGKKAEQIAYQLLKKKYLTLKWTSENADIGLAERNTSKLYDMYYISNNERIYVEIKALGNEFFMSIAEYDFAIKHSENHVIYFVNIERGELLEPANIKDFESVKRPSEYAFRVKTNVNV